MLLLPKGGVWPGHCRIVVFAILWRHAGKKQMAWLTVGCLNSVRCAVLRGRTNSAACRNRGTRSYRACC